MNALFYTWGKWISGDLESCPKSMINRMVKISAQAIDFEAHLYSTLPAFQWHSWPQSAWSRHFWTQISSGLGLCRNVGRISLIFTSQCCGGRIFVEFSSFKPWLQNFCLPQLAPYPSILDLMCTSWKSRSLILFLAILDLLQLLPGPVSIPVAP